MAHPWEAQLDPQQWRAVSHPGGPVIVLAGAGSGKTRVLTYRIAYLLEQGISPTAILALTFTNKAADTMRERLLALVGELARQVSMGTFHSIFARWLRQELKGYPVSPTFTIYDEDDSKAVIRDILREMGQDPKLTPTIRSLISRWKNEGYSWREVQPITLTEQIATHAYKRYEARLRAANALDFDDLLLETERLFRREPAVLEAYRQHIQYILVDEYQDTNPLQYRILRLLAQSHRNLFVVGDDAQSIYGFRGADVRNFRYMERDFAPVEIIRLEQNYRSTPQILSLANALLAHSTELYPKQLFTHNPAGPTPYLYTKCLTVSDEAQWVVHKVREELMRHHLRYSDIAILYRTNAYSRAFEEKLRAERIPYKLIGTLSFYQREEIKHFLAFLRFILNPHDEQALLRILAVRGEGIGEVTIERLRDLAAQQNVSLWQVLPEGGRLLRGPAARALQNFHTYLVRYRESVQPLPLAEQIEIALEKSGLFLYYAEDERAAERKENLQSFVASAYEFVEKYGPEATLRDFLQNIALISSSDDPKGAPADAVWLSTVHGVKGMEFHTVFLVGVMEGLFPHAYALEEGKGAVEEERRIFYVALTRAQRHLYLTCPTLDSRYGAARPALPSRFLAEMGLTEKEEVRPALSGALRARHREAKPTPPPLSFPPHELAPPDAIQVGLWVEHTHFGRGRVLEKEENGAAGVVRIQFDTVGIKKLDLRYAKLRIVS